MFSKLFLGPVVLMAAVISASCAAHPIGPWPQALAQYTLTGRHGDDNFYRPLLYRIPTSCAGRTIELRAEYRTEAITTGTKTYHGIHFDYEVFVAGGSPTYPGDWKAEPSHEWQPISRTWNIPADMRSGYVRIGLQGVSGVLSVRGVSVSGC